MSHALALLLTLFSNPAGNHSDAARWGQTGHRIVARTAALQLSSHARREVHRLLGRESLAEVSTWADQIRSDRPATSSWHYVNIPIWESRFRSEFCPPSGCVIGTLEAQQKILADRSRPRGERAEALKWVVHLVGDIHMPLHAGDRGDRGGNDVRVMLENRQTNLHAAWDSGLLNAMGVTEEKMVGTLNRRIRARGDLAIIGAGTPVDWAMESHDVARDVVYPFLPTSLTLDQRYVEISKLVVEDRLLRASVRLAAVLERALGDD